jgi:periplasmic divalent cation tolerance protein
MTDVLVLLSTAPSDRAEAIARTLVEDRLCACVNLIAGARSIYRWQGAVEDAGETLLVMKTVRGRLEALEARLRALHPYEVPELLALPVESGASAYLAWVREVTAPATETDR